jgi:hypothetical protein
MDGEDGGRVERNEVGREGSHGEKRELPLVDRAVEGRLKCNKHAPYPEFVQDPGEIHLFLRRSTFNSPCYGLQLSYFFRLHSWLPRRRARMAIARTGMHASNHGHSSRTIQLRDGPGWLMGAWLGILRARRCS